MATDHLSTTFAALADPTRRAILARLAQGEATVNELAEPFALSLPTVSKHLQGAAAGWVGLARTEGAMAAVPAGGGTAARRGQLDGGLPPVLG